MKKLDFTNVTQQKLKGSIDGPDFYSGKGQDAYIKHIFDYIGTTNKFCVEFGSTEGYAASNTLYLEQIGWTRVGFDLFYEDVSRSIYRVRLTTDNICNVFKEKNIPKDLDFVSIDVDGNDYWLLKALLKEFSPRVIMTEINSRFDLYSRKVMKYDPDYYWDGHSWYGASAYAFKLLGEEHGYTLVFSYVDEAFLVRNDCLTEEDKNLVWENVYTPNVEIYIGTDEHINPNNYIDI